MSKKSEKQKPENPITQEESQGPVRVEWKKKLSDKEKEKHRKLRQKIIKARIEGKQSQTNEANGWLSGWLLL